MTGVERVVTATINATRDHYDGGGIVRVWFEPVKNPIARNDLAAVRDWYHKFGKPVAWVVIDATTWVIA